MKNICSHFYIKNSFPHYSLESLGIDGIAYPIEYAIQLIDMVKNKNVAILGGDLYRMKDSSIESTYDNWYCETLPIERLSDFVQRSHVTAKEYLTSYPVTLGDKILVLFVLEYEDALDEHEIVKYNPLFYNVDGAYCRDEWTSVSDIGENFDGKVLTAEEYLMVESCYIDAACDIIQISDLDKLVIEYIEKDEKWIEQRMKSSKIPTQDLSLLPIIKKLNQGYELDISEFRDAARLCLREYVYIVFCDTNHSLKINFGYDYYMYIKCLLNEKILQSIVVRYNLFLNPR